MKPYDLMPSGSVKHRGTLFEKTAPLDPPQKLLIGETFCHHLPPDFVYLCVILWLNILNDMPEGRLFFR
jgi:hypothetical protein